MVLLQISGVSAGSSRQCFIGSPHQEALNMVAPLAALKLPRSLRKAVGAWRQVAAPVGVALQSCECGMNQETFLFEQSEQDGSCL